MSPEIWSSVASVGTFIVVGATAIAALAQLRHMSRSNQMAALTKLQEAISSENFSRSHRLVTDHARALVADAAGRAKLRGAFMPPEFEPVRDVANLFEHMGTLVRMRVVDTDLVVGEYDGGVLSMWRLLEPIVLMRRRIVGSGLWGSFEYLAVLSERSMRVTAGDRYPRGAPRMAVDPDSSELAAAFERELATDRLSKIESA